MPAAAEVFKGDPNYGSGGSGGSYIAYSNPTEFNALTRFAWYETTSNRVKNMDGSAAYWWERSPRYDTFTDFCLVYRGGQPGYIGTNSPYGLAPFGCL